MRRLLLSISTIALLVLVLHQFTAAAEWARLTPENWDEFAPQGKEVDAIYGDFVLRNRAVVAVIANPVPGRNANLTINNAGGSIIDLTRRDTQSDQLGAVIPGLGRAALAVPVLTPAAEEGGARQSAPVVALECAAPATEGYPSVMVRYELADDTDSIEMITVYTNPHEHRLEIELVDTLRADGFFEKGFEPRLHLAWVYDEWWGQAYGVVVDELAMLPGSPDPKAKSSLLRYSSGDKSRITLEPGATFRIKRRICPGANLLDVKAFAARQAGEALVSISIAVSDPAGPTSQATVRLAKDDQLYGWGRTGAEGMLRCQLPAGKYQATISAIGRPTVMMAVDTFASPDFKAQLAAPGIVIGKITDHDGKPIACKVDFQPRDKQAKPPNFGPTSAEFAVQNLVYTASGEFQQDIDPGDYDVIVSHGPEYDAVFTQLTVERGKPATLSAKLARSVDTTGWVSADFHSHASPSGDNTSSQLGRVLNLLAEHVEFAPCTEHAVISSYEPHLARLEARAMMATCSGIELTGLPLPLNHQNAFPLVMKARTQNGGGPYVDVDPLVQVARLAMWDNGAEKLMQQNHPNLPQLLADRDLDGQGDGGFEAVFGYLDVIEVHPPGLIFAPIDDLKQPRPARNPIFHWLQMLNLGYRIPGVVNTDAHYNFHGSGFLRNYVASSTDDPGRIDVTEMVRNSQRGRLIMTNGPFLEVELRSTRDGKSIETPVGDDVAVAGGTAQLHIRVQCPNWFDVNRVQVFVNGVPAEEYNFTRQNAPARFAPGSVKFDQLISLELKRDAHLIVAAAGEGLELGAVMGPAHNKDMPVAVSNPIFVDVDGNGFQPNRDMLGVPLPVAVDHQPSRATQRHPHARSAK